MKQLIILLALWFVTFNHARAQQNYKETYKKAYAFTNTNPDSAMIWAEKCLSLAKNNTEKYKAYHLQGVNAKKLAMHGQAMYSYTQARALAANSTQYFAANNNLAKVYLNAGQFRQARKLNDQSVAFFEKTKNWLYLSYSYELKAAILREKKNEMSLSILRKALALRRTHFPEKIGYTYRNMAKAFASFGIYDSAIVYQRLVLKDFPTKSASKTAFLNTQLAEYLIQNDQTQEALEHLEKVALLKKIPLTEFFWNHTFGLYFVRIGAHSEAHKVFLRCETLYNRLLAQANDIVSQHTIYKCGKELYQNLKQLASLNKTERKLYGAKLQTIKVRLANEERYAKERDAHAAEDRKMRKANDSLIKLVPQVNTQKTTKPQSQRKRAKHYPIDFWVLYLGIGAIATWATIQGIKIWRKPRVIEKVVEKEKIVEKEVEKEVIKVVEKELSPNQQRSVTETILLEKLGFDLSKRPEDIEYFPDTLADKKDVVLKYYRGMSYRQLGQYIGKSATYVKKHCDKLIKHTAHDSFVDFMDAFRKEHKDPENPNISE